MLLLRSFTEIRPGMSYRAIGVCQAENKAGDLLGFVLVTRRNLKIITVRKRVDDGS